MPDNQAPSILLLMLYHNGRTEKRYEYRFPLVIFQHFLHDAIDCKSDVRFKIRIKLFLEVKEIISILMFVRSSLLQQIKVLLQLSGWALRPLQI